MVYLSETEFHIEVERLFVAGDEIALAGLRNREVVMENRAGPVADASGALLELEARQTGVRQRLVPWTPTGLPWRHGMELNLEPDPPHPTLMYRVGATVEDSTWTAVRPEDPATIRDTAWVDA